MVAKVNTQHPVKRIQTQKKIRMPKGRVPAMLLELAYQLHSTRVVRLAPVVDCSPGRMINHRITE